MLILEKKNDLNSKISFSNFIKLEKKSELTPKQVETKTQKSIIKEILFPFIILQHN